MLASKQRFSFFRFFHLEKNDFLKSILKLNSVEELKSLKLDEASSVSVTTTSIGQVQPTSTETSPNIPPPPPPPPMTEQNVTDGAANLPPPPPQPQPPSNPVKEDPRYIKYFKMLKMGVAEEAGKRN